jgi:glutathione synthase/RimK-type ligase-like ATP-grasp enzyme
VPSGNDPRANISAGGRSVPLEIGDVERGIIEAMSKKLVADGMYFVGIDVIGDKVVENNAERRRSRASMTVGQVDVVEPFDALHPARHWAITSSSRCHLSSGPARRGPSPARRSR